MHESPRLRRLRSDLAALERLRDESSVLWFRGAGNPVQHYQIVLHGKSLARVRGRVAVVDRHEVEIKLGASYPRTMPEIRWLSPIYHPNISEIGMVCLGGYGTHWVPSLNLDELCGMLWDMARFHNYDVRSPYNRDAALWVANQTSFRFPLDPRPLRDVRAALGRVELAPPVASSSDPSPARADSRSEPAAGAAAPEAGQPGSRAGRYAEFVRKFAGDLRSITPETRPGAKTPASDALILLDDPVLSPAEPRQGTAEPADHPRRLRAADEEIVFIE